MHISVNLESLLIQNSKTVAKFARWFYRLCMAPLHISISSVPFFCLGKKTGAML